MKCFLQYSGSISFVFFQAEDVIRAYKVTGVQTCALPIFPACSTATRSDRHAGTPAATLCLLPHDLRSTHAADFARSLVQDPHPFAGGKGRTAQLLNH